MSDAGLRLLTDLLPRHCFERWHVNIIAPVSVRFSLWVEGYVLVRRLYTQLVKMEEYVDTDFVKD